MHDCLLIAEMQTKILGYVIQSDHGHRTVAALARTCKALAEPCLDILWHRQECGLGALMKTLPADLWEVSYGSLVRITLLYSYSYLFIYLFDRDMFRQVLH
jgi:hypothetical protein